ncbi:FGGY family carbohydrate kinase [Sphingobacterium daejeonense]|uniref:FGGY family carbohydrate kinase n=1 Tax=Sphingobacterium daejeonense TaxID=371142 RepID=UPI0010C288D0|nr:FGGY family carbohydrate kinase [Sphingobacterium daejeonense]VTQ01226.1 Xylulose kinase [Sphingobacterium daejeonense]
MSKYFFGLDVGTQGARVVLVDENGELIASDSRKFQLTDKFREEQSPSVWWNDCEELLTGIIQNLPTYIDKQDIFAISVTSTSGTVIPLDSNNQPLHDAIMYSDPRSADQGQRIKAIAEKKIKNGYTGFNSSSGISKMLWFVETFPEKAEAISLWVHASDYLVGKLSGNYHTTDYTNVLKSAYDLEKLEWPNYVTEDIRIKDSWLQNVVPSGTVVGTLKTDLAEKMGFTGP